MGVRPLEFVCKEFWSNHCDQPHCITIISPCVVVLKTIITASLLFLLFMALIKIAHVIAIDVSRL